MKKSTRIFIILLYFVFICELLYIIVSEVTEKGTIEPLYRLVKASIVILLTVILHVAVHELSHAIVGRLYNFDVYNIRILNLLIDLRNKKRLKFVKIPDILGNCDLMPTSLNKKIFLIVIMAGHFFGIILCISLFFIKQYLTDNYLLDISIISLLFIFYSIIPIKYKGIYSYTYFLIAALFKRKNLM